MRIQRSKAGNPGPSLGDFKVDDVTLPDLWKANLRAILDAPLATLPVPALPHRHSAEEMERAGLIEVWRNRRQSTVQWEQRIKYEGGQKKTVKVRVQRVKKLEACATLTTWAAWCLGLELDQVMPTDRKEAKQEAAVLGMEATPDDPLVEWGPAPAGTPDEGPSGLAAVVRPEHGTERVEITPHPGIPQTGAREVTLTLGGCVVEVQVRG